MHARDLTPDGPLGAVDCSACGSDWTLLLIRDLAGTPDDVWALLTDPARLRVWSPFLPDRDLAAVGPVTTTVCGPCGAEPTPARVVCADRPVMLEIAWPHDRLRWTLRAGPSGTEVTLQHTFLDRDWAAAAAADWHLSLDDAQRLLCPAAAGAGHPDRARWQWLQDGYTTQLMFAAQLDVDVDVDAPARRSDRPIAHTS